MNERELARVRALLAKAESTEYPDEAEALTAKATELMARHGIESALAAERAPVQETVKRMTVTIDTPYTQQKSNLLGWIAEVFRCRAIQHVSGRTVESVSVFGFASDLETVQMLYTSLLLQAGRELVATPVPWGEHPAAYRRSWLHGFATVVTSRLRQVHAVAVEEHGGTGTELVLADRAALVNAHVTTMFPDLVKGRRPSLSGSGRRAGAHAGRRADIGLSRVGGAARRQVTA